MIELVNLQKSFGSQQVLRGITLTADVGETLVILGRSGTGKSVMLKCIVGLLEPDEGAVLAAGREVAAMNRTQLNEWRSRVGFLFQGGALYDSMSVQENLVFPLRRRRGISEEEKTELAREKLEWVGLERALEMNPSDLSGGMRKRAALARTLMTDPEVILYDEPTTGLDPVTSNEISQLIARLKDERGVTGIVVTHDMLCARLVADRVAFLHGGTVLIAGTWDDIRACDQPLVQFFLATDFTRDPLDLDEE